MTLVLYTDPIDEYIWVHEVPSNLVDETKYRYGVRLGPPELVSFVDDEVKRRALNNALASAMIYDYNSMNGRRDEVLGIIRLTCGPEDAKSILRGLVGVFQQASFIMED